MRTTAYCAFGAHGAVGAALSAGEDKPRKRPGTCRSGCRHSEAIWQTAASIVILLVVRGIPRATTEIGNVAELQQAIQALFAGVLLVVLGLELMDTLRNYFIEHRLRVELLISVALIAVARHVIQLDYEHTDPWLVAAMALLVLSLAASYVGVRVLIRNDRATRVDAGSTPAALTDA
jgi:uncharacterized membrane protein (DUF373 family)